MSEARQMVFITVLIAVIGFWTDLSYRRGQALMESTAKRLGISVETWGNSLSSQQEIYRREVEELRREANRLRDRVRITERYITELCRNATIQLGVDPCTRIHQ